MGFHGIEASAKRSGVRLDTVHYYERSSPLARTSRLSAADHLYSEVAQMNLHFIRRAQALGFSLSENREFLALSTPRGMSRDKSAAYLNSLTSRSGSLSWPGLGTRYPEWLLHATARRTIV